MCMCFYTKNDSYLLKFKLMKKLFKVMLLCVTFGTLFACSERESDDSEANSGSGNTGNGIAYPEAIDLGLPSGIKWASFNVGASSPEEYGSYYAWGETEEKKVFRWDNYKWCDSGDAESLTKYCTKARYGTVDNKTVLDLEDDVAHVKWGGTWRIPTDDEVNELGCCERERVILNGVEVYKLTGPNGNSIFLPLTGSYWGKENSLRGTCALYWTSEMGTTFGSVQDCYADVLYYGGSGITIVDRSWGLAVRPVCE